MLTLDLEVTDQRANCCRRELFTSIETFKRVLLSKSSSRQWSLLSALVMYCRVIPQLDRFSQKKEKLGRQKCKCMWADVPEAGSKTGEVCWDVKFPQPREAEIHRLRMHGTQKVLDTVGKRAMSEPLILEGSVAPLSVGREKEILLKKIKFQGIGRDLWGEDTQW